MSDSFTKLFGTILASTVWQEPDSTRLTWITMLAMADRDGLVSASVPGLAHMARVSLPQVEAALATFLAPDPYSRTPDNDGRRIEAAPGGWRLLNHGMYRQRVDAEVRRERKREWDRQHRPSGHARAKQSDESPTQADESAQNRHITEADADAEASKAKATVHSASPTAPALDQLSGDRPMPDAVVLDEVPAAGTVVTVGSNGAHVDGVPARIKGTKPAQTAARFPEFWAVYPVKKGKAAALRSWKAKGCDAFTDQIIAHVRRMEREDIDWLRGFIPHGSTYITGERWDDDPKRAAAPTVQASAPSKTLTAIQKLQEMKRGPVDTERDHGRVEQAALLGPGTHAGQRHGGGHGDGVV
jgi:hypothetical protein